MDSNTSGETLVTAPSVNALHQLAIWFSQIHGYASVIVCAFGIFTNVINVTILTRRDMHTPTNFLLSWLAVSDILTMVPYIPFAIHFYCVSPVSHVSPEKNTFGWTAFMLFLINFTATTHTISIWLGVSLAVFRFVQMRSTRKGPVARQQMMYRVKVITVLVFIASTIVLIPNYLTNKIDVIPWADNATIYSIKDLKLATNETEPIVIFNVVTYATVAKIIPCILMIIFSGSLVLSLSIKGRRRRRRLSTTSMTNRKEGRQSKTTRMLLVVIILFLITELPQGILIILSAGVPGFFHNVYIPLGDLQDLLALINNAINFVLYCIMSQQFRRRFIEMYIKRTARMKDVDRSSMNHSLNLSITRSTVVEVKCAT